MGWFKKRFGEHSTYTGLGLLTGALQAYLAGGTQMAVATALAGVLAIVTPNNAPKPPDSAAK